ncbi:hypothetical protein [Streptomyces sp. NBRC 110035]|uniref:hypothetical protein n=1 Tax=Streptomyces sp. NBRC 110035 TaxID=1547867 RepID=UPI0005A876F2|nr:hypothetical protein [Streptomyces sp. NBRC 110035]
MITRTFTPDQLETMGLPHDMVDAAYVAEHPEYTAEHPGAAIELHREYVESRRWESVNELIFRAPDDGKAYRVHYREPLTEMQDSDPWNSDQSVEAVEVEQYDRTVKAWRPAAEPTHEGPDPSHGGLTTHRGRREDCSGPDCGTDNNPQPVDLSDWADSLSADGLQPDDHTVQLGIDPGDGDRPRIRLHFAFHPDMTDDDRDHFVMQLSKIVMRNL